MEKIEHCQTILTSKDLAKLKKKAGTEQTQKALQVAVEHYLNPSLIDKPIDQEVPN